MALEKLVALYYSTTSVEWFLNVLKSHFCFSWCVLNASKHCEGSTVRAAKIVYPKRELLVWLWKRLGSDLAGNDHLHLLLWRSVGTHGSSWSLSDRWEADWKRQEKSSRLQWLILSWKGTLYSFFSSDAGMPIMLVCFCFSVKKIDWAVASGLSSRISFIYEVWECL